jgi:hypothetical protein
LGVENFGFLLSSFGAGSLLGMAAAGSIVRTGRRGLDFIVGTATLGVSPGTLGFISSLLQAIFLTLGAGVLAGYLGVVLVAWLQERTKPSMHGRVMSLMMFAAAGSLLVVAALSGAASRAVRGFQ